MHTWKWIGLLLASGLAATKPGLAQTIIPDNTLGGESSKLSVTTYTTNSPTRLISGGAARGSALFHSFELFNVDAGKTVYFENPAGIEQIFSRVTGPKISSINGKLGILGPADFFLINPNGIIFGPKSNLDISGSFLGTTANVVIFDNGFEFGKNQSESLPLLEITINPGLQIGSIGDGTITQNGNLSAGKNLTLAANVINIEGVLYSPGDLKLIAAENIVIDGANIKTSLQEQESGDVGNIFIQGQDITIKNETELLSQSDSIGNAGNITLLAEQGNIQINNSEIQSRLSNEAVGKSGDIALIASTIELLKGRLRSDSPADKKDFGRGDAGAINIVANQRMSLFQGSEIGTRVNDNGSLSGDISINAGQVELDKSVIFTSADGRFPGSMGGGDISVYSTGAVSLDHQSSIRTIQSDDSFGHSGDISIYSQSLEVANESTVFALSDGNGDSGQVQIKSPSGEIVVTEKSSIQTILGSKGTGQAGDISIQANYLEVVEQAQISSSSEGNGNTGSINIRTKERVYISDGDRGDDISSINSRLIQPKNPRRGVSGGEIIKSRLRAGDILIETPDFEISDKAEVRSSTDRYGHAGDVRINADNGKILITNQASVKSTLQSSGEGNAGDVTLEAQVVEVSDGFILSKADKLNGRTGEGNSGKITINAPQSVILSDDTIVSTNIDDNGQLTGGIYIKTGQFKLLRESELLSQADGSSSNSKGPGDIEVIADTSFLVEESSKIFANQGDNSFGNAGKISIRSPIIEILDQSIVETVSNGIGDSSDLTLVANEGSIRIGNESKIAASIRQEGIGKGGNIILTADQVFLIGPNTIVESRNDSIPSERDFSRSQRDRLIRGGNIIINSKVLSIDNASLQTNTAGLGDAGDITINATTEVKLINSVNAILTQVNPLSQFKEKKLAIEKDDDISFLENKLNGNAGDVFIAASELEILDGSRIVSSTQGEGNAGKIIANIDNDLTISGQLSTKFLEDFVEGEDPSSKFEKLCFVSVCRSGLYSVTDTTSNGVGTLGGEILVSTARLKLTDGGHIDVSTSSQGKAGNITLIVDELNINSAGQVRSSTSAQGAGGNIEILSQDSIRISDNDSGLFATGELDSSGTSGSIKVESQQLELQKGSVIETDSTGSGDGGNLRIEAERVSLNNSRLTASTTSGTGGNIELAVDKSLLLRSGSQIRTNAGGLGNGGNINLDSPFIVAIPDENSDISANAMGGDGGEVNITAQSVLGLQFRPQSTFLSDITASSNTGNQGNVELNTPNVEPDDGLNELPIDLVDGSSLIDRRCDLVANPNQSSRFIQRGRWGVPTDLSQAFQDEQFLTDLGPITAPKHSPTEIGLDVRNLAREETLVILEARGWNFDTKGEVQLLAGNQVLPGIHRQPCLTDHPLEH